MSLLQIDDALCHWLAGHNVILDFLDIGEPWPKPVANVAELLSVSTASATGCRTSSADGANASSPEEEKRRLEFVNAVCGSALEWEKTHSGEQFPWAHILAGLLEEVVTDSTTYFDCEYVMPRPEASTARKRRGTAECSPLRGTASLLVLLELDLASSYSDDNADSVGGRTGTEAQAREGVTTDRTSRPLRDPTSTPSKLTSEFDEDEGLVVQLNLSSSLSDITLYDVVEHDDSDFSIGVEIEESSEAQKRKAVYHKDVSHVPRVASRVCDLGDVPSVDTEYNSGSHFHTATSSSCLTASTNTTGSGRRALPWRLYEDLAPSALELHLFPSPFHPKPLVPLLCAGDERNVVPLMCSVLHQRRALGRPDVPAVGILLPRSGSTCEVLFGWMEREPRSGRTLSRIHICARGLASRIPTVFDLERPYSALCLMRFLAGLGALADQLRAGSHRDRESRVSASRGQGWRTDTYFKAGLTPSCEESEGRIRLWAYEVGYCK
ncbi:hypothetical protein LXA43DRAFT_709064 [Ganoderma leucocontextum]|nr:hypothetical protein LXA43DRAFT_709064 [Ganoderma leucocontextum]